MNDALDTRLLAAHASGNKTALVSLYTLAAVQSDLEDEMGFFLTQAYVFALETNDPAQQSLRERLVSMGRETPLQPPESCL